MEHPAKGGDWATATPSQWIPACAGMTGINSIMSFPRKREPILQCSFMCLSGPLTRQKLPTNMEDMPMSNNSKILFVLLLFFAFLLSASAFAQSKSDNSSSTGQPDQSLLSSTLDPHKLSGILVFILAASTALSGVLMKKRKAKPRTHHLLAYTTLIVALAHGIYNLLAG
jgi:hypothetical protein